VSVVAATVIKHVSRHTFSAPGTHLNFDTFLICMLQ